MWNFKKWNEISFILNEEEFFRIFNAGAFSDCPSNVHTPASEDDISS